MLTSNKEWVLPSAQDDIASQLVNKSYQQKQRSAILSFIKSKGCKFRNCCDIGAHIGIWSEDLVKYFQHVFAFEPIKELRDCFIKNVSGKNHTLYPFGLSESEEKMKFDFDPKRSKNTCVDSVGNYISEVKRLDDLNLNNIDYIKMDVESHELKILKGAQRSS